MQIIRKYFTDLSGQQINQFSGMQAIYENWNSKINVISRRDIGALYEKHVLHSLAIAKVICFRQGTKILDVGTGGGFPGIPLAILFPDSDFVLVDSIAKKIKVVNEVVSALDLKNVSTIHSRVENIDEKFDFIVSRAVTDMKTFKGWTYGKVAKNQFNQIDNGILSLKGGDLSEELTGVNCHQYHIRDYFAEDFFLTKKVVYIRC